MRNISLNLVDGLQANPPLTLLESYDASLLGAADREEYVAYQIIPWRREGKTVVLAVAEWSEQIATWIEKKYGMDYRCITVPWQHIHAVVREQFQQEDDEAARELLWQCEPTSSAKHLLIDGKQGSIFLACILIMCGIAGTYPFKSLLIGFAVINAFYATTILFKALLFIVGTVCAIAHSRQKAKITQTDFDTLPIYTILIPLYKEKAILPRLIESIKKMDYPLSQLDVKLVLEADDTETIEAARILCTDPFFDIVCVPPSEPRTKPKACNYAIRFARGEYITIYDAEDMPEPDQLLKVLAAFRRSDSNTVCIQARLNYYNRYLGLLPALFAIEYASWFEFLLPGLHVLDIPIPLGGTSNHFSLKHLKELHYWDPYNVTEDADIGIRMSCAGYKAGLVDSTTWEEATAKVPSWLRQRSRWIKGYIQTYLVHMRNPLSLLKRLGIGGFLGFQFFIGAPVLTYLLLPIMIICAIGLYFTRTMTPVFPDWVLDVALYNLIGGTAIHLLFAVIAVIRRKWWRLLLPAIMFPFYWALHSIASFMAVKQLITNPHYWEKTSHGHSTGEQMEM